MKSNCSWKDLWCSPVYQNIGLLLLRLVVGGYMLTHGWQKVANFEAFSAGFPDPLGVGSTTSLALIIMAEFGCSLLLIVGLFTRLAAIPLIIGMFVAAFVVKKGSSFGEVELPTLYMWLYIVILFVGGGKYSLDFLMSKYCSKCTKKIE